MTEKEYQRILGKDDQKIVQDPGKGKMLIQCLDRSGSMSGTPMKALKEGAMVLGKSILEAEHRPFEKFVTITYDNKIEVCDTNDIQAYTRFIE